MFKDNKGSMSTTGRRSVKGMATAGQGRNVMMECMDRVCSSYEWTQTGVMEPEWAGACRLGAVIDGSSRAEGPVMAVLGQHGGRGGNICTRMGANLFFVTEGG